MPRPPLFFVENRAFLNKHCRPLRAGGVFLRAKTPILRAAPTVLPANPGILRDLRQYAIVNTFPSAAITSRRTQSPPL